jgi:hypothetical protein
MIPRCLPPGFDQVQLAGIIGQENDLNFGPGSQSQFHLLTGVDRQVFFDQQSAACRKPAHHQLDQANIGEAASPQGGKNGGLLGCWFESARCPALATPTIIQHGY